MKIFIEFSLTDCRRMLRLGCLNESFSFRTLTKGGDAHVVM